MRRTINTLLILLLLSLAAGAAFIYSGRYNMAATARTLRFSREWSECWWNGRSLIMLRESSCRLALRKWRDRPVSSILMRCASAATVRRESKRWQSRSR